MVAGARRELVVGTIVQILAPFIGGSMASAAVRMNCEKHGLDGAYLQEAQIERLLSELEPGLRVFLGGRGTTSALAQIREELAQRRSVP